MRFLVVVVPLGVAVDELEAVRGDIAERPVPVRHPVRQELEQVVHPEHTSMTHFKIMTHYHDLMILNRQHRLNH